jgi:hypothetical protein
MNKIALSIIVVGVSLSCQPRTLQPRVPRSVGLPASTTAIATNQANLRYAPQEGSFFLDASAAKVQITTEPQLVESALIKGMQVPSMAIDLQKADFAQVLRCGKSYVVKSLSGELLFDKNKPSSSDDLQWAWRQAVNHRNSCQMVGSYIVTKQFEDIAAAKGEYYYLLNPCVAAEHSATGKDTCSFNVVKSQTVLMGAGFSAALQEKAQALSQAEAELSAASEQAMLVAKKLEMHLRACEELVAHDTNMLNMRNGLITASSMTVGGIFGSMFIMGGGPNGAIMGAQMIGNMIAPRIAERVFNLPPYILNQCVDPKALLSEKEKTQTAAVKNKNYEQEFGVQALAKTLQNLVSENGEIAKKQANVEKLLLEMHEENQNVVTYDMALKKATKMGIDLADPATLPK